MFILNIFNKTNNKNHVPYVKRTHRVSSLIFFLILHTVLRRRFCVCTAKIDTIIVLCRETALKRWFQYIQKMCVDHVSLAIGTIHNGVAPKSEKQIIRTHTVQVSNRILNILAMQPQTKNRWTEKNAMNRESNKLKWSMSILWTQCKCAWSTIHKVSKVDRKQQTIKSNYRSFELRSIDIVNNQANKTPMHYLGKQTRVSIQAIHTPFNVLATFDMQSWGA